MRGTLGEKISEGASADVHPGNARLHPSANGPLKLQIWRFGS